MDFKTTTIRHLSRAEYKGDGDATYVSTTTTTTSTTTPAIDLSDKVSSDRVKHIWVGSAADYNNLAIKNSTTLYVII